MARYLISFAVITLLGSGTPLAADEKGKDKEKPKAKIEVGKPSPDFTLKDQDGKDVKLSSFKGKKSVLIAFYPKDFTGGCTEELKGFGADHDSFVKSGVQVLGVSVDPVAFHKKFCDSLKLPFPLLSDEGGKVSKLYGVLNTSDKGSMSARSVFLVNKDGTVKYADDKYDLKPADDHAALMKAVKEAGGASPAEPKGPKDSKGTKGSK